VVFEDEPEREHLDAKFLTRRREELAKVVILDERDERPKRELAVAELREEEATEKAERVGVAELLVVASDSLVERVD
jgi:hypothetical protein